MKNRILCTIIMLIVAAHFITLGEGVVVTVTTKTYNGEFAPKNALAIYVVDLETDQYLSTVYLSTAATTYEGDELKNYTKDLYKKWYNFNANTYRVLRSARFGTRNLILTILHNSHVNNMMRLKY